MRSIETTLILPDFPASLTAVAAAMPPVESVQANAVRLGNRCMMALAALMAVTVSALVSPVCTTLMPGVLGKRVLESLLADVEHADARDAEDGHIPLAAQHLTQPDPAEVPQVVLVGPYKRQALGIRDVPAERDHRECPLPPPCRWTA